jgi:2-keto-4-pentenoate hydratase/2-oxohepta-3-ene-1,7-dioic acid hydratase in catechol pathway
MFTPKGMDLPRGWPGRVDGDRVVQLAAQTLQAFFTSGGALREHAEYPLTDVDLRAPVLYPPSIRIFDRGDFAFGNTAAIHGPEDEIRYPEGSNDLCSVPAVSAVIGEDGAIGGFTAANAWTAPDLPGIKSRDFALSIGPVLVTPDEYDAGKNWDERVSHAAKNTVLRPGDLLVADLGGTAPAQRGEVVEVAVEGIGVLRNRVAS